MKKYIYLVIFCLIATAVGFVLGRLSVTEKKSVETKEEVKWVKSTNTITDTIIFPAVKREYFADTIYKYSTKLQEVDTFEILKDYNKTREYSLDFSNDTVGVFKVDALINQNQLISTIAQIQPIQKQIVREVKTIEQKRRMVQPFVMIGTSLKFDVQKITGGIDLNEKWLIGVSGVRWDNKYNYTIDLGIKF